MNRILLLLFALLVMSIGNVQGQTRQITGKVISSEDKQPLPGVNVYVKEYPNVGTTTGIDGNFKLVNVPANAKTLVFSFIGFQKMEKPTASQVNVALLPDNRQIEEVVVTGYGVVKKVAFTGAAAKVDEKLIRKTTDADLMKSLQSNVAGLSMNISTGQPGAFNSVNIRGMGSINAGTEPLYIVDGIPITTEKLGMRTREEQTVNPLASLNSADIENISVLKDATATSIYGSRAANGVIVITTKRGKEGKARINFDAKYGVALSPELGKYGRLDRDSYIDFSSITLINSENAKTKEEAVNFMKQNGYIPDSKTNTNWYSKVTRPGKVQDYNLDISGGTDAIKYFVGGGYYDEQGFVISKGLTRYSGRINLDAKLSDIFSIGINSTASFSKMNSGAGGGFFSDPLTQAFMMIPTDPVYKADGGWNMNTYNGYNPVAQWNSPLGDRATATQYKAIVSPYLKVTFNKNLHFMSKYGMDFYNLQEFGRWSKLSPQGVDVNLFGEQGGRIRTLWTFTNTLNYINSFNNSHNINVLLGQEAQKANDDESYLAGNNFASDRLFTIENAAIPSSVSTKLSNYSLSSYFANLEYDYLNKYYLSGSFRFDGSSRFYKDNRWASFWSVGAKYRLINEKFMEFAKGWLSNATLRASYGTVGNQDVGWYKYQGLFSSGYNYNSIPGMIYNQAANRDLRWETTQKFNIGTDWGFFNNRLVIEFDYYNHLTKDMIFDVPVSLTTGLRYQTKNVGEMRNSGVELLVNAILINSSRFRWDLSLNMTHNRNRIEKLGTGSSIINTYTIREVGNSYNTFRMREYAGVNPQTGEPLWYANDGTTTSNYNKAAYRIMGTADPKLFGGLTNNFKFLNFDLYVLISYKLGGKVYNAAARYDENLGNSPLQNTTKYVYERMWRKPGDITNVPAPILYGNGSANSHSSRFLFDGTYARLKNVTLGYTLSESLSKKVYLNNLRFYFTAENLYTFLNSEMRGRLVDPETGNDGVIWWNYPVARRYMFGINLSF